MQWQPDTFGVSDRVGEAMDQAFGYELFAIYAPLLAIARGDDASDAGADFAVAYLSRHVDARSVTSELRDVGLVLIDAKFDVQPQDGVLRVGEPGSGERIALFALSFDADGLLRNPSPTVDADPFPRSAWHGLVDAQLHGRTIRVPVNAEGVLDFLYGADWRGQEHGDVARHRPLQQSPSQGPLLDEVEEVYWANFYAHHELTAGSTFCDALRERSDLPDVVVDIGCGDGRDSWAFARDGRRVVGLDRSTVGIRQAQHKAEAAGLDTRVSFAAVDVADAVALRRGLDAGRQVASGASMLFYLRFFLHSIPEDVQETLMGVIAATAVDGDMLAAEFRTEEDAKKTKVYGEHYRRFQNGPAFGRALGERYGFTVVTEEQGTGLAPYLDEDPYVYRVLARHGKG